METPNTEAGRLTEQIMQFFWLSSKPPVTLTTEQYNKIYSHVLDTLNRARIDKVP